MIKIDAQPLLSFSYSYNSESLITSGLWVAKALEGDAKVSEDVTDNVTMQTQRGGSCNNDGVCQAFCSGCAITRCIFKQCVCAQCIPPKPKLRVRRDANTEDGR
ncbi:hypothetical protein Bca101_042003 [Brassica carinata]